MQRQLAVSAISALTIVLATPTYAQPSQTCNYDTSITKWTKAQDAIGRNLRDVHNRFAESLQSMTKLVNNSKFIPDPSSQVAKDGLNMAPSQSGQLDTWLHNVVNSQNSTCAICAYMPLWGGKLHPLTWDNVTYNDMNTINNALQAESTLPPQNQTITIAFFDAIHGNTTQLTALSDALGTLINYVPPGQTAPETFSAYVTDQGRPDWQTATQNAATFTAALGNYNSNSKAMCPADSGQYWPN